MREQYPRESETVAAAAIVATAPPTADFTNHRRVRGRDSFRVRASNRSASIVELPLVVVAATSVGRRSGLSPR